MTDLANEIRTLELELNTLIELGITDADYQEITSLLQAGYEIIDHKYGDDSVYICMTMNHFHYTNLLRRDYFSPYFFLIDYVI